MALVLVALLIGIGHAQARDIYCASDSEASNLNGGYYEILTGSYTKMYRDSSSPSGQWEYDWRGPIVECDPNAANGCVFRFEHNQGWTKTKVKGFQLGLGATGGAYPVPFPVGMFNFSTQKTTSESWNVVNQTSANPGDRKRPVAKHEWINTDGHYTGAYKYVGEQQNNCHAYVLDPNYEFGHWKAQIAGDTVQTWESA